VPKNPFIAGAFYQVSASRVKPVRLFCNDGPYAGEIASVDHIIPRAVAPELDNCIANLELLPLKLNQSKNDKTGALQIDLARKLHSAGLLSSEAKQKIDSQPQR